MKIKKINSNAIIPARGSKEAAGYDLYACVNAPTMIAPHQTVKIGTGIAVALPENTFGAIFARSGLATNYGVRPANAVGVIDSDYRGEIIVALHNDSDIPYTVNPVDRIAQLVVIPYLAPELEEVDELDDTERGDGSFGHSGK